MATLLAGLATSGCASRMVPFTHELRTEHELAADEIQRLQFYVSHTVKLHRERRLAGRAITDGHLKLTSGTTVEEVVIEEHTPGVAVEVGGDTIRVSFDAGSAMEFSLRSGRATVLEQPLRQLPSGGFAEPPDPFPGHGGDRPDDEPVAVLGSYFLDIAPGTSSMEFRGKRYDVVGDSFEAHLMIDAESLDEVDEEHQVLGGRRIADAKTVIWL